MPAGLPAPCMGKTAPPTGRVSSAAAVRVIEHRRPGSGFQQSTSKITGAFGRQISDSPQHTQFTCGVGIPLPELTQHLPHLSTCRRGSENFQRPSDSLLSDPQRRTLNLIWFLAYSHHATPRILQGDSGDCVFPIGCLPAAQYYGSCPTSGLRSVLGDSDVAALLSAPVGGSPPYFPLRHPITRYSSASNLYPYRWVCCAPRGSCSPSLISPPQPLQLYEVR